MLRNCCRHKVNTHIKRCSTSLAIHLGNATPTPTHCPLAKITIAVVVALIKDDGTDAGRSWSRKNHVPCTRKYKTMPSLGETTPGVLKNR